MAKGPAGSQARQRAEDLVVDAAGRVFSGFGHRNATGRIWAVLYLSPEPLDAETVRGRLGVSTGSVSTGLRALCDLGLARREKVQGRRRSEFSATPELWPAITEAFRRRERARLARLVESLQEAHDALADLSDGPGDPGLAHQISRVEHLASVGGSVLDLLDALMERTRVEVKAVQKWLSVSGRLGGEPLSRLRRRINAQKTRERTSPS